MGSDEAVRLVKVDALMLGGDMGGAGGDGAWRRGFDVFELFEMGIR